MTWPVRFADLRSLLLGSAGQVTAENLTPPSNPASGLVRLVYPLPKDVGPEQLPALRLALLLESRDARMRRQSKLAAAIEADLHRVTHQILARGKCFNG